MAKKKEADEIVLLLKDKLQDQKVIFGKDRVLKGLKAGQIQRVILAVNCPADIQDEVKHYASLGSVTVTVASQDNEELGVLCKKGFLVSVLGIGE